MKIMTITNNLIINLKQLQKYCFISRPQNIPPNRKKNQVKITQKTNAPKTSAATHPPAGSFL